MASRGAGPKVFLREYGCFFYYTDKHHLPIFEPIDISTAQKSPIFNLCLLATWFSH